MTGISLSDILSAREERVRLQTQIINSYHCPIISFTMNIAGPRKSSVMIRRAFKVGLAYLDSALDENKIHHKHIDMNNPAGPLAIYSVDDIPSAIKEKCVEIEEGTAMGRLYDLDVIDEGFNKLSRPYERGCIVCGAAGRVCAAGRIHPFEEIVAKMEAIMSEGLLEYDATRAANMVKQSLIKEVRTTPKPGLVDLRNNGSHTDMTVSSFERSAEVLLDYFRDCFIIGSRNTSSSYETLFLELRNAGLKAEKTMFQATRGVNTHKGAIFSFGILCGAWGYLWTPARPFPETEDILQASACIAQNSISADLNKPNGSTAGERIYLSNGVTGIRGEAASGFRSVLDISLPVYRDLLDRGYSASDAGAIALLHLIANIDDTTIYNRGGFDGLHFAKAQVKSLLEKEKMPSMANIEALDNMFIQRNLSAGGAADLLAVTYFLYEIENNRDEQD